MENYFFADLIVTFLQDCLPQKKLLRSPGRAIKVTSDIHLVVLHLALIDYKLYMVHQTKNLLQGERVCMHITKRWFNQIHLNN